MGDDTTLPSRSPPWARARSGPPVVPVLVVLWSVDEPGRVGEVLLHDAFGVGTFGRHTDRPEPGRLQLWRVRPGRAMPTGSPRTPHLSRRQLEIEALGRRGLAVHNVGRTALLVDGVEVEHADVAPGQLVELRHQLLLRCDVRPAGLRHEVPVDFGFGEADRHGIVGESPAAWALRARIAQLAGRPDHVLITGASGVGKELVARALHAGSGRRGPLVARNAATLPESLVDAELFGNVRNYPNPGMAERPGLIGEADGGTLFLDEIGELPVALQAHLLRVLDGGEYHRLGEARPRKADLRLIGATNRPADELKEDVLARFQARIEVPALADRVDDVPLLARHLLRRHPSAARFLDADGAPRIAPDLVAALVRHHWRTNVRELARALADCADHGTGPYVTLDPGGALGADEAAIAIPDDPDLLTADVVRAVLDRCGGVQERAWRELGLRNRFQLHRLLKKLDLG